jgi:hypothetical protein
VVPLKGGRSGSDFRVKTVAKIEGVPHVEAWVRVGRGIPHVKGHMQCTTASLFQRINALKNKC